jgi:hypothetical protein
MAAPAAGSEDIKSWNDIAKASDALDKIAALQDAVETCIDHELPIPAHLKPWLDPRKLLEFWAQHCDDFLNEESSSNRLTGSDLLFVLMAHVQFLFKTKKEREQERGGGDNLASVVRALQCQAQSTPEKQPAVGLVSLAGVCASILVKGQLDLEEIKKAAESARNSVGPLGLVLGDDDDLYAGEDEDPIVEDQKAAASAPKAHTAPIGTLVSWCSRLFLDSWYVDKILCAKYQVQEPSAGAAEWMHKAFGGYTRWSQDVVKRELPRTFGTLFNVWVHRQLTGVGALRMWERNPHRRGMQSHEWSEYLDADSMPIDMDYKALACLKTPTASALLSDAKHPFHGIAHLALATTIFASTTTTETCDFADEHVIFRDDVVAKRDLIDATTLEFVERRPFLVQVHHWGWVVHFRSTWFRVPSLVHCILLWMYLVQKECDCTTRDGTSVSAWIATLTQ